MSETRPSVTCYRDGEELVAWGEPKEMEPRQFWLPLSDDAHKQASELESVAGREVVVDEGMVVAFR